MNKTNKIDKLTSACLITDILLTIINTIEAIVAYKESNILICMIHLAFAILFVHVIYKIVTNNMA